MNSANKGYTITGRDGDKVMGMKNGKPFKIMMPRGLEKYTTDILNIRFGKNVPSKAKHELEMLISGEGFTNTWTIKAPDWGVLFQDSLVDHEGRFRERLAKVKALAQMSEEQMRKMKENEVGARMAANTARRAASMPEPAPVAAVANAVVATAAANAAVANAAVANVAAANAMANSAPPMTSGRAWYNPLGYFGYGGKKTRKGRKASKKSHKASKKTRKH